MCRSRRKQRTPAESERESLIVDESVETSTNENTDCPTSNNADKIHGLLVQNNDLKHLVELKSAKVSKQRRTIMDLKTENNKFKKKLSLRNSFNTIFRKRKLEVRRKSILF